jgi:hypothetical protein
MRLQEDGAGVKNLFDVILVDDIKRRILSLRDDSERQWGTMSVAQTLAHCTRGLEMGMGVIHPERARFPVNILGLLIKPFVFRDDTPVRRNSPSSPELFPADPTQCELERERSRLIVAIDSFAQQGAACCSRHPHPFFGALNPQQWAILMYKHLDHHLRQFSG